MLEGSSGRADPQTIIQKFIKGSVGEVIPIPLVIGISATPERFTQLLTGTQRTLRPVTVDPEQVRASGLLKEVISLYNPTEEQPGDMSMLRSAAQQLSEYSERWTAYALTEGEAHVDPILVVQVEDGTEARHSGTSLGGVIEAINEEIGPLPADAYAHAFQEGESISESGHSIRYLAPSRIVSDPDVKVVLFKSALSTGWDCPRAEVMISFRKVKDETLIAQLVGRMVRAPLARRIDADEYLNTVSLYLPRYDAVGLARVIERLSDGDPTVMPPTRAQRGSERISLAKRVGSEDAFDALEAVPSFSVPKRRKTSQVKRLMKLARALAHDGLREGAVEEAQEIMTGMFDARLDSRKKDADFVNLLSEKGVISLAVTDATLGGLVVGSREVDIDASEENINDLFNAAGRRFGEGLHKVWWRRRVGDATDPIAKRRVKLEAYALIAEGDFLAIVEGEAQKQAASWLSEYSVKIGELTERQRQVYSELRGEALAPDLVPLRYPPIIESRTIGDPWDRHLYADPNGVFHAKFNGWESMTLQAALEDKSVVGWVRNPSTDSEWTQTVPYQMDGLFHSLRPDFLFVRQSNGRLVVDILDPHDPGLPDAPFKAVGLAAFARDHGSAFGRIELLAVVGSELRRLDLQDEKMRGRVLKVRDRSHLMELYDSKQS